MFFLTKKHILFSFLLIKKGTRTRNQQKISLKETKKDETKNCTKGGLGQPLPTNKTRQVYGSRDSPCPCFLLNFAQQRYKCDVQVFLFHFSNLHIEIQ